MLFINPIHLIISVTFSSSVTPCLNAIFCPLIVVLLIAKHKKGPKGHLDQVAAQVRSLVDGVAAGPGKFDIRGFGGAAMGGYKQLSIRLFWVADIVNGRFQR